MDLIISREVSRAPAERPTEADIRDSHFTQLCATMALSVRPSLLGDAIMHIDAVCSWEQMLRLYTKRNIAAMARQIIR
jgi:hypothetical protein